jgi:hypothetical protein
MIRLPPPQTLDPETRFAISLLVDQARLLPADGTAAVELRVLPEPGEAGRFDADAQLRAKDGVVEVSAAALRLVTRIAGVVDEQRSYRADQFGRVPPEDNWLAARGVEREPVVTRFAMALRTAVIAAANGRRVAFVSPWPEGRRWAAAMTHDLDVVSLWPVFTALRGVELARKGRVRDVLLAAGAAVAHVFGDPVWAAAQAVLGAERRHGIRSSWFIITGTPTFQTMRDGDVTYSPESAAARRIIDAVLAAGAEVGLHGSFETWTQADRFEAQRHRLASISGRSVKGVRQHFLRLRPGTSHAAMQAAGFTYDSSCGFADRNGFRSGVADVIPAWQDAAKEQLDLDVVPFAWMDRALSKYRGIEDPRAWIDDALVLANTVQEVGGVWNGIWHPNLTAALGFPGAETAFERLCGALVAHAPWAATLGEIVEWRRARRSARAVAVDAQGRVRVKAQSSPHPIVLEDADGKAIPATAS